MQSGGTHAPAAAQKAIGQKPLRCLNPHEHRCCKIHSAPKTRQIASPVSSNSTIYAPPCCSTITSITSPSSISICDEARGMSYKYRRTTRGRLHAGYAKVTEKDEGATR
jgi:hypothetical protein